MLEFQVQLLTAWCQAADALSRRVRDARHDERGEITATTALIVLLVIAAIAAGGIIATKITNNANNVPEP